MVPKRKQGGMGHKYKKMWQRKFWKCNTEEPDWLPWSHTDLPAKMAGVTAGERALPEFDNQ